MLKSRNLPIVDPGEGRKGPNDGSQRLKEFASSMPNYFDLNRCSTRDEFESSWYCIGG